MVTQHSNKEKVVHENLLLYHPETHKVPYSLGETYAAMSRWQGVAAWMPVLAGAFLVAAISTSFVSGLVGGALLFGVVVSLLGFIGARRRHRTLHTRLNKIWSTMHANDFASARKVMVTHEPRR